MTQGERDRRFPHRGLRWLGDGSGVAAEAGPPPQWRPHRAIRRDRTYPGSISTLFASSILIPFFLSLDPHPKRPIRRDQEPGCGPCARPKPKHARPRPSAGGDAAAGREGERGRQGAQERGGRRHGQWSPQSSSPVQSAIKESSVDSVLNSPSVPHSSRCHAWTSFPRSSSLLPRVSTAGAVIIYLNWSSANSM